MRVSILPIMLLVACSLGCIPGTGDKAAAPTPPPASAAPADAPAPVEAPADAPAPPMERVVAKAGVGKKGQSLEGETGMVVEPVKQLIKFEQKAVLDIQVKQALDFYKASNGSFPKSHEEFMQKVVKANNLKLPELPAGQKYVFDPESGQLMVERPQQ